MDDLFLQKVSTLERSLSESTGAYNALMSQKNNFISEMSLAHNYINKKDRILSLIMEIKERLQSKDISFIEDLLTSLVNDVIPHNRDEVKIISKAENNRLSLDIFVKDGDKYRNVFVDKGGSIQNIISIGLRLITLSRSRNRRFVVFDEADQGIKVDYIPRLAEILFDLSKSLGIQILYISHHDTVCFEGKSKIIKLRLDKEGCVITDAVHSNDEDSSDKEYFTNLRIKNFRRHKDTLLNLSPYLNIITGDNDIGKSTVVEAITSFIGNEYIPSSVRDECKFQSIEAIDNQGMVFQWSKNLDEKGGAKFLISSLEGDVINENNISRGVPDWWHDFLFMKPYFGHDIHISKQFKSHFIIGSDVNGKQRAELLSFGSDMRKVAMMVNNHTDKVRLSQSIIRSRKKDVEDISNKITGLLPIVSLSDEIKALSIKASELQALAIKSKSLSKEIIDIDEVIERITISQNILTNMLHLSEMEVRSNSYVSDLSNILLEVNKIDSEISNIKIPQESMLNIGDVDTSLVDMVSELIFVGDNINNTHELSNSISSACDAYIGNDSLASLISSLDALESAEIEISSINDEIALSEEKYKKSKTDLSYLITNEMKSCPSCGRSN
jgi:DNA repair ATPase RecN